jgi:hypothetical protein
VVVIAPIHPDGVTPDQMNLLDLARLRVEKLELDPFSHG